MEVFLMLLTVAILGAVYVMVFSKWKTVVTASGADREELEAKYEFLKEKQIRCRLRSDSGMAMGVAPGLNPDSNTMSKLMVKEQDIKPALELLEQYEAEQLH